MTVSHPIDRARYLREGYLVVRQALDPARIERVNGDMARILAAPLRARGLEAHPGRDASAFHENARRLLAVDVGAYISAARLTQMLPSAQALMSEPAIFAVLEGLGLSFPVISTRLSNHIVADDIRIPGGYHKSPAHQDWRSMQGSLDSVVIWAPTTTASLDRSPLEVVPGSHLWGLCPTADHIMTPTVCDPRLDAADFTGLELAPGDLVVFSSFLVHRTGERGDGGLRIAFSVRFNNADEPSYVRHDYPTPYRYSYQTELIVPDFPRADDIAGVFPRDGA